MLPILEIQSVSKKFNIHHEGGSYLSLRDKLSELVKFKSQQKSNEDFWALKEVSFNVMPGESIGIIGKNGAGKSTLLKILSKITPPTDGKIICRGRIASLLEVGTGFHPELTGRENVYLNGSILGMKKREIDAHFDEIIDFAGTVKFLDTPLKHYSSGMQLRLAFAVAAFLEPEVLIIDEVLAVGDADFQKKCLAKMEDVSRSGRTVLFVSHNMEAVRSLCARGLVLSSGKVDFFGDSESAIHNYLSDLTLDQRIFFRPSAPLVSKGFELLECRVEADSGNKTTITNGNALEVSFDIKNHQGIPFSVYLFVHRDESLSFISSDLHHPSVKSIELEKPFRVIFQIPKYLLNPGHYRLGLLISDYNGNTEQYLNQMDLLSFLISDDGVRRDNRYSLGWSGAVSPLLNVDAKSL